ncbi:MAG TPA: ABC transporter permease [Vicinamibacterales bacterium]|nr:ABC transporter permease [Vicinamibacterales bacterium]
MNLLHDLRYALRMMTKNPGFSAVAAVTLALGIAATTTVFSAIDSLLLRPLPFAEPGRLALVWGTNLKDGQPRDVIAGPNYIDLQRQNTTLEGLAAFHLDDMPVRLDNGVGVIGEMTVTPEFFSVLGVRPILGRDFQPEDGLPGRNQVALLGYGFWQQRFGGDPNVIGRTLEPLGQPHTIVGVLPPDFLFFTSPEVATPLMPSALEKMSRTNYHYWVVGRLKPGLTREQAEADLDAIMERIGAEHPALRNWEITLDPLQATLSEPVRPALLMLLAAAGMLLLIGCANVASLLLARGMDRRGEFAVRTALGASRGRLTGQLLAESLLLASVAGGLGVLAASALVDGLARILPSTVAIPGSAALVALPAVDLDARVLLFATLLSAVTVLLFGLVPALRLSPAHPHDALQDSASRIGVDHRSRRSQRALILAETALATVLLVAAGLMARTVGNLLDTHPGFQAANVVAMYVGGVEELDDNARARFYASVVDRVRAVPGVAEAGLNDYVLLQNEDDYQGLVPEGLPLVQESVRREEWRRVSPGYFAAMRIALLRGRGFADSDNDKAPSVAIVNEAMARKYWPGENPVGKRLLITHTKFRWTEIVGLVADERTVGIDRPAKPMVYVPFHRAPRPVMGLMARTEGDPRDHLTAIQQAVWSVDRTRPIYGTVLLDALVGDSISVQQLTSTVSFALAAAALALTAVGIFAVVSYTVARRTREFGIRAALGAQPRDLRTLVVRDELWVACGGVALGAAAAAGLARTFSSLLYGVAPTDLVTFAGVATLLLCISGVACWLPARRATRVEPMVALRER